MQLTTDLFGINDEAVSGVMRHGCQVPESHTKVLGKHLPWNEASSVAIQYMHQCNRSCQKSNLQHLQHH